MPSFPLRSFPSRRAWIALSISKLIFSFMYHLFF
jgi:hypothetical protein